MNVEKVNLPQNSPEWHEWRKSRICASDSPAILGVSPWSTMHDVWLSKTNPAAARSMDNFATRHGHNNEHVALKKLESAIGVELKPICLQWEVDGIPYGCSLDGANEDLSIVAELKCPLRKFSPEKILPSHYKPQVQHQLMPISPRLSVYAEYYAPIKGREEAFKWFETHKEEDYITKLIKANKEFWKDYVLGGKVPEKIEATDMNDDPELFELADQYSVLKDQIDELTSIIENVKLGMVEKYKESKYKKVSVGGFLIQKIEKQGSVDYKKLVEDEGIKFVESDYRKKGSSYVEVRSMAKKD